MNKNINLYRQNPIDDFRRIHKVRKQGYALDENEYDHGIICIYHSYL